MKKSNKGKLMKNAGDQRASGETIGIDLGDKVSRYCKLNAEGEVIEEGSFQNTESSIKKHFGSLKFTRIAMETGTQSGWISRLLKSYGHEVLVAHARDLQGISRSGHKNDRNDAEKLGRYARLDRSCSIQLSTAPSNSKRICVPSARGMPSCGRGLCW